MCQVIALTEELLVTAKQNDNFVSAIGTSASTSDTLNGVAQYEMVVLQLFSLSVCVCVYVYAHTHLKYSSLEWKNLLFAFILFY